MVVLKKNNIHQMEMVNLPTLILLSVMVVIAIFQIGRELYFRKITAARSNYLVASIPPIILITINNYENHNYLLMTLVLGIILVLPYFKIPKNQLAIPGVKEEKLEKILDEYGKEKFGISPEVTIKYYRVNEANMGFRTLSLPSWLNDDQMEDLVKTLRQKHRFYQKTDLSEFYKTGLLFIMVFYFIYQSKGHI